MFVVLSDRKFNEIKSVNPKNKKKFVKSIGESGDNLHLNPTKHILHLKSM
jgi:mRNA-degrading endonuclease RelE of RelBE toxin-antitoxin system